MAIHPNLHDQDLYAWALGNAALLRDGRLSEIDIEHVAEELESMGRSERRELVSAWPSCSRICWSGSRIVGVEQSIGAAVV